jgi:hypothetical protein
MTKLIADLVLGEQGTKLRCRLVPPGAEPGNPAQQAASVTASKAPSPGLFSVTPRF